MLLGQFLIASDRQNPWMAVMATATVVAIALDLVLIPWCQQVFALGALGTALASLIVETGMCACAVALLPKGTLGRQNAGRAVRVVLAGSLMLAAVWWARGLFIAFPIGIGIGIYFVLITRLRVFSPSDWVMLINLGRSILRRMGWPFGGQQKLDKQSPRLPTG
jgi:Na+-driven multidrug efflux pump